MEQCQQDDRQQKKEGGLFGLDRYLHDLCQFAVPANKSAGQSLQEGFTFCLLSLSLSWSPFSTLTLSSSSLCSNLPSLSSLEHSAR